MAENGDSDFPFGAKIFFAFIALYLAAANALFAMSADTCTGGSADSPIGIVWSICLFSLALVLLRRHRFGPAGYLLLVPLTAAVVIEADFALRLFINTQFSGRSICSVMFRDDDYGFPKLDDQWVIYAWFLTYLTVCIWLLRVWAMGLSRLIKRKFPSS